MTMEFLMDLHTHTLASIHAYSTVTENAKVAKQRGIQILGTSDHGYGMPNTTHSDHFYNLCALPDYLEGVRILKGMEANILNEEGILMEEDSLYLVDYAIASLHPNCYAKKEGENDFTQAIINTIKRNPSIRVIGHPDDNRFPLDYELLVKTCVDHKVALELNCGSIRPHSYRKGARENILTYLPLCKEMGCSILVDSDAHMSHAVGDFEIAKEILTALDFPTELIVNGSWTRLEELLGLSL